GRLAAAGGPEKSHEIAFRHDQIGPLQGSQAAISLDHAMQLDNISGFRHARVSPVPSITATPASLLRAAPGLAATHHACVAAGGHGLTSKTMYDVIVLA